MQVIGSPLAAGLLSLDGVWGLRGWQWLFLVEGLPTIVLGMYIHHVLVDGPAKAAFLTAEEREIVILRKAQNLQVRHFQVTRNVALLLRNMQPAASSLAVRHRSFSHAVPFMSCRASLMDSLLMISRVSTVNDAAKQCGE